MADPAGDSPCIGLCRLDAREICQGCHRSLAEIAAWPTADAATRRAIRARARRRLADPQPDRNDTA